MEIELSTENIERILAALATERTRYDEEVKAIDDFITGTCGIMESRDSYLTLLREEEDALHNLALYFGEINDANKDEEESE